jgi:uncharacterized protein
MFRSGEAVKDCGWIFVFDTPRSVSLTMWFVFFPIDVVMLDKDKKVIELVENFQPWKFYDSRNKCQYFIELRKGTIKQGQIGLRDKLAFDKHQ